MAAAELTALKHQLAAARSEISKLHRQQNELTRRVQKDLAAVRAEALAAATRSADASPDAQVASSMLAAMKPIGCIESCFPHKNGTPRQPRLAPGALARLRLTLTGVNAGHSLDGLEQFSHVWLIFLFHKNGGEAAVKAKVRPPRLGGQPVGMFACRTPHRPCAIGLSLVTLLGVEDDSLVLAGADLVDGTPILDVKPFVPYSDTPPLEQVRAPPWVAPESGTQLRVRFSDEARRQLAALCAGSDRPAGALRFFGGRAAEAEATLADVLRHDPRSVYRKSHCADDPYRVCLDGLDATCRFSGDEVEVEAVRLISPADTIGETVAAGSE